MMQTALLEVKNLSFSRSDRVIFRNAAFSLAPKESLGLCGPIGCGKTTLLRILTGLERPQTMSLSLEGVPVTAQKDFQRLRRKVGYVLQNPDDQLFFPEVIEDVMFGPLNLGLSYAQARTRALDVLSMLGIANLADPASVDRLTKTIESLQIAKLIVSHDFAFLKRVCGRMVTIRDAQILALE